MILKSVKNFDVSWSYFFFFKVKLKILGQLPLSNHFLVLLKATSIKSMDWNLVVYNCKLLNDFFYIWQKILKFRYLYYIIYVCKIIQIFRQFYNLSLLQRLENLMWKKRRYTAPGFIRPDPNIFFTGRFTVINHHYIVT